MSYEYIDLQEYLKQGKTFDKFDYIYEHSLTGYPLKPDFDTKDLYLVRDFSITILDVLGVTSGVVKTISINSMTGNWWILSLPPNVKKQIFNYPGEVTQIL